MGRLTALDKILDQDNDSNFDSNRLLQSNDDNLLDDENLDDMA